MWFEKGYSAQQCLLAMLEKRKMAVNNGQVFGAIPTSLLLAALVDLDYHTD